MTKRKRREIIKKYGDLPWAASLEAFDTTLMDPQTLFTYRLTENRTRGAIDASKLLKQAEKTEFLDAFQNSHPYDEPENIGLQTMKPTPKYDTTVNEFICIQVSFRNTHS